MVPGMQQAARPARDILLCSGIYMPTCAVDIPPVRVFCEAVVLNSVAYVWIDGVDNEKPLLLPAQSLQEFRSCGTLRAYLEDEKHLALEEQFDEILDLCLKRKESATTMIRAIEIMHDEGLPPDQALVTAHQWGVLINELDQAERASYQLVTTSAAMPASTLTGQAPFH